MLKRLHLRNFTVFENAEFDFGPGLNVIVGTNGTGKSHVLKAGYALLQNISFNILEHKESKVGFLNMSSGSFVLDLDSKLMSVFQPIPFRDAELVKRNATLLKATLDAAVTYDGLQATKSIVLPFEQRTGAPVIVSKEADYTLNSFSDPVFIPAKEVLTMGWLLPLYDLRNLPVDQTYPDLLRLLGVSPLKALKPGISRITEQLQQLIGGKSEEEGGRFYLSAPDQPRMEMNMVAEGMRKFATLYKLLANGTLTPETTLFWDEPEANLNPALLKEMAAVLTELARAGFQIILATHSLFLLKELHILSQKEKTAVRYFGLSAEAGGATQVATADSLTDLPNLVALDVEMAQSDTFLDVLNQADANV